MLRTHSAFNQMNRLRGELDRVFGLEATGRSRVGGFPPVNIWEDDHGFYVEAELPGLELEDLEILVQEGDELSIKGSRKQAELEGGVWRRRERGHGEFERAFKLSTDVDVAHVNAELKHGVLTITLPKSEAVKPRKIKVNVAK